MKTTLYVNCWKLSITPLKKACTTCVYINWLWHKVYMIKVITYAVTNKAQKKNSEASMGFKHMTSAILVRILLYWLSYEASQEAGQVWVLFTPVIWREWCEVYNDHSDHMTELWLKNRSERDLCSCEVTYAVTNKAQKKFLILSISEIHVDTMRTMEMTWKDFRCFIRIYCAIIYIHVWKLTVEFGCIRGICMILDNK